MKHTYFRRAAIGSALIGILAVVVILRSSGRTWSPRDYTMLGGAVALVLTNLISSYYLDARAQRPESPRRP